MCTTWSAVLYLVCLFFLSLCNIEYFDTLVNISFNMFWKNCSRICVFLRSCETINKSYFCVRHKNRRKHNQHFKTADFHNKFTLLHIKSNIFIWKTKFASLSSSIYFIFLPLEMQIRLEQTKICHAFSYFVWKEMNNKPLKVSAAKSRFSSVYVIGTTCFNKRFSFYVITERHYFSWKFIATLRFF